MELKRNQSKWEKAHGGGIKLSKKAITADRRFRAPYRRSDAESRLGCKKLLLEEKKKKKLEGGRAAMPAVKELAREGGGNR